MLKLNHSRLHSRNLRPTYHEGILCFSVTSHEIVGKRGKLLVIANKSWHLKLLVDLPRNFGYRLCPHSFEQDLILLVYVASKFLLYAVDLVCENFFADVECLLFLFRDESCHTIF